MARRCAAAQGCVQTTAHWQLLGDELKQAEFKSKLRRTFSPDGRFFWMTSLSIFQPLLLNTRQIYLNRWKPGQPLEFNEPLCVPSARESSVGMETNFCLESALSCVLSPRAPTEAALAQIHNWAHQSHLAQIKALLHISTQGHRTELGPAVRPWKLFPGRRSEGLDPQCDTDRAGC